MSYICVMKPIKRYSSGGITDDRTPSRREKDRKEKLRRMRELEKKIKAAKGTPEAKALVEEYRDLTGVK